MWQTNAVALRAGGEAMLIDSPYFPDELEALPGLLASAGFEPDALVATHADYDHVLGRLAFPGLALGLGEPSVLRLREEPGATQRELRDKDAELYVERPHPLSLGQVQALPVPGSVELGSEELELHPAEGHTRDGMAVMARWCGVLCVGDYLSNVEIPMVEAGLGDYRATLARLAPLVDAAETVVPGHGAAHTREDALRILDEDVDYLDALERGEEKPALPKGRDTREQRRIHSENLERLD
jgi:glyoxylase-like metal-dependent hydrolase (beta-lactamase superfamily II)